MSMKLKLEWIYAVLAVIFGGLIVLITPPFQIPDEINHYARVYQISEGNLRAPLVEDNTPNGVKLYPHAYAPAQLAKLLTPGHEGIAGEKNYYGFTFTRNLFSVPVESEQKGDVSIPNSGLYSPLVYAPQAICTFLARNFFGTVGAVYYGAKFGALIFTIICIFWSMKLLPEKKLLIFLVAFMPMFLFEATSNSSDAVTYDIAILSTAYLLSLRKVETSISRKEIALMLLIAICLGLAKQVYGVILLLYLLMPVSRFGGRKNFCFVGIGIIFAYFISGFGWMQFAKSGLNVSPYILPTAGVDMASQLEFIENNPLTYLKVNFNTLVFNLKDYYIQFVGVLGWLSVILPNWFYMLYGILLLVGGVFGKIDLSIKHRFIMILSIVPVILAMFLYMYLTWTPIGGNSILGVQGRYFIPCALMCLSALSFFENKTYEIYIACFAGITSGIITILSIIERFYL